jgi:hypothetical protein
MTSLTPLDAFAIYLAIFIVAYASGLLTLRRLKFSHGQTFQALGEPNWKQSNLSAPRLRLTKFIFKFEFLRTHDAILTAFCILTLLSEVAMWVVPLFIGAYFVWTY